jgi:hypothetical protein
MAINWDLYNKRLNINGSSERERNLNCLQRTILSKLPNSLSCKTVVINGIEQSIEIVKTNIDYKKVIHSLPNKGFNCGDYVLHSENTYLITEIDADDEVYTSGKMQLCNYILKWQNSTGTILSYPCIASTSSTAGISEGKIITVGDAIYTIKLPFDSNTLLINIDDRFIIDDLNVKIPQVYAVSKPNRTEFKFGDKGLIELTMKQSKYNDISDRKDLGVCNYIEPTENPNPPDGDTYAVIASDNEDNKVIVGYKDGTTLSPKFFKADKTENSSIVSVWEFSLPVGLEEYIHLSYTGNNVNIYADDKFELYGITITVSVSDGSGNYKGSITLTLGGWY